MAAAGKIWRRSGLIAGSLLMVLAVSAYLLFHYRLKDLVEEIVLLESGYTYELKMQKFSFSLRKKFIKMKGARITCLKPQNGQAHYSAVLPELFLSLDSWELLLKERKLDIDSFHVKNPEFHIYRSTSDMPGEKSDKPVADVLDILKMTRLTLGIRSMDIRQGSFTIHPADKPDPGFTISRIDFRVRNFSDKNDMKKSFLAAEDISLEVGRQKWDLPNGSSLFFNRMLFSGKTQFFELDSCFFETARGPNNGRISLAADVARWSSHRLPEIYSNGEVYLDTIFLAAPVIDFTVPERRTIQKDSNVALSAAMSKLFGDINIKYIEVDEGKLLLASSGKNSTYYSSRSTDLIIEDLDINRDSLPHITVGNIDLKLNEVLLSTADSQYVLTIGEFGLVDNNLICKKASFKPTERNRVNSDFTITLPSFLLKNVSLPDILEKRFRAASGTFLSPDVRINRSAVEGYSGMSKGQRLKNLYHSLNGLAQLINVKDLSIENASVRITSPQEDKAPDLSFEQLNALIRLNQFLESEAILNMKEAVPDLTVSKINLQSSSVAATIHDLELEGDKHKNFIASLSLLTRNGVRVMGKDLYWQQFDWDKAMNLNELEMDSVDVKSLLVEVDSPQKSDLAKSGKERANLSLYIRKLNAEEIYFFMKTKKGAEARSKMSGIRFDSLYVNDEDLTWKELAARFEKTDFRSGGTSLHAGSIDISSGSKLLFNDVQYKNENSSFSIPSIRIAGKFNSLLTPRYDIDSLLLENPVLNVVKGVAKKRAGYDTRDSSGKRISIGSLQVNKGKMNYSDPPDSFYLATGFDASGLSLSVNMNSAGKISYDSVLLNLTDMKIKTDKLEASLPVLNSGFSDGRLALLSKGFDFNSGIRFEWNNSTVSSGSSSSLRFFLSRLSGSFKDDKFSLLRGEKLSVNDLIHNSVIDDGKAELYGNDFSIYADSLRWKGINSEMIAGPFRYVPVLSRDSFFAASKWQKDFLTFKAEGLHVKGLDPEKFFIDSSFNVREIHIHQPLVNASRDKNLPFLHGKEKPMPTRLLSSMARPLKIDSVIIHKGTVHVNEISNVTGREGQVVFSDLNASIRNINSRPEISDSLRINARAMVLGNRISSFKYRESYGDSLSGFRLSLRMPKMYLMSLSEATNPLAAVNVQRGRADTLFARMSGNKYAAYGEMNFLYRNLKIRILDKQDTAKRNFLLSFENLIANNLVLRSRNRKSSTIFYKRDREKFIFNYWIKSVFSGIMTGAGVKSNKKFEKEYKAVKDTYSLPTKEE